jgi:hypothetical protein
MVDAVTRRTHINISIKLRWMRLHISMSDARVLCGDEVELVGDAWESF